MTKTFNGCSYSDVWVAPSNWKTISAKKAMEVNWYVQSDFKDPNHKKPFQFRKKLNKFKSIELRRAAVLFYLEEIPKLFSEKGYNPITKQYMIEQVKEKQEDLCLKELLPETPFVVAIDMAFVKKKLSQRYMRDLHYTLASIKKGINDLNLHEKPIVEVKRKDIKNIFEYLESKQGSFSAHKFNKYVDSLNTIYLELLEWEAVDSNIIRDIKKRKKTKQLREVLTKEQRKKVVEYLYEHHREFHDFVQVFFHSGIRITEILSIKVKDVDLSRQSFKVLVKKGTCETWKEGVIKDIALPFWENLVVGAKPNDYVFSWGLTPGELKIDYNAIRLRWSRTVQIPLGIKVGIYQLKHSNLDEITELLGAQDAARMANHTDTKMVLGVYAVGEKVRQNQRLKQVANSL